MLITSNSPYTPVSPTFFLQRAHLFFFGDLAVAVGEVSSAVGEPFSSRVGGAWEEAGRSERGVAWIPPPIIRTHAVGREQSL